MEYVFFENSGKDARIKEREIRTNLKRIHNHLNASPRLDEDDAFADINYMLEYCFDCDPEVGDRFRGIMIGFEGSFEAYEGDDRSLLAYLIEVSDTLQKEMKQLK